MTNTKLSPTDIIQKAIDLIESTPAGQWSDIEHGNYCPFCAMAMVIYLGDEKLENLTGWKYLNALAYGNQHIISFDDNLSRVNEAISIILEERYFLDTKENCLELLNLALQKL